MSLLFRNNFSNLLFDVAESSQSKQEKLKEDMRAGGFMTGRIFCFQVDGPITRVAYKWRGGRAYERQFTVSLMFFYFSCVNSKPVYSKVM